ncbi:MAG: MipA/OmpV family protein [Hyphomicrobiaceae bacterium]|nr:MipA/OmpV family protein [Hyphomicrobiaceae bacterium]
MPALARVSICAAGLVVLAATPAGAQSTPDLLGNRWQVGGLVYVSPSFEGSKSYDAIAFPFIAPGDVGNEGFVQIKGADDVRLRLFHDGGFEFGPLAGYRFGRDGDDVTNVAVGDVDGGLVLGGFATYRTGPLAFSVSYHHQVTGDDTGGLVRFSVEHTSRLSPAVNLTASVGTDYASEEYMTAFFAVPGVFAPDAGFKDVFVGATATVDLSDRWSLHLLGRYSRLIGDAADSPIVETANQLYGGLALSYKFNWNR